MENEPTQPVTPPLDLSHTKKNIYPAVRHTLLVIIVLAAFLMLIFLLYQNGKSIYDNGI